MSQPYVRFIGDMHGRLSEYIRLAEQATYSVQLGDLGCEYDDIDVLNPDHHKVIAGNHDNYRMGAQPPHFAGDYGHIFIPDFPNIFFVRGAKTFNTEGKTPGKDYWLEEQISEIQAYGARRDYVASKPIVVASHECPAFLLGEVGSKMIHTSFTSSFLEQLFVEHQPKYWLFGHHHVDWQMDFKGCKFVCVPFRGYQDFSRFYG